jgi:hypothetical protein
MVPSFHGTRSPIGGTITKPGRLTDPASILTHGTSVSGMTGVSPLSGRGWICEPVPVARCGAWSDGMARSNDRTGSPTEEAIGA